MPWTCHQVAGMIDHTCLKAYATREDFQKLCREAMEYGFKSVAGFKITVGKINRIV